MVEARVAGDGWRWPFPDHLDPLGTDLREADARWMRAKAVGHPLKTFAQSMSLSEQATSTSWTYICCGRDGSQPPEDVARAAERRPLLKLETGHWPMVSTPHELATLLGTTARAS